MKNILIILIIGIAAVASELPTGSTQKCEKQILQLVKTYKSKNLWFRVADTNPGSKTYRTATEKFGQWIEINAGEVATLHVVNEEGIKEIRLNHTNCEIKISTAHYKDKIFQGNGVNFFTDSDLLKLVQAKENLLIYTWSPRMIYSVKLLNEYAEIANKLQFKFIPLLDPEVNLEETKKLMGKEFKYKIQKVASNEIIMREMITHYPSTLVVFKGELIDPFIFGAMPKDQLEYEINQRIMNKKGLGK